MRAVEVGFDVVGFDLDQHKISGLAAGRSHIDDVTDADVARALATGRYRVTASAADLDRFDVAVITVPTPLREGVPDLSYITSAVDAVGEHVAQGCTVVLESTTYPGTTDELVAPRLEEASGLKAGVDFHVGFSPERIDPGNVVWDFVRTPKVVSGLTPESLVVVQAFYDRLVERTVPVSTTRAAELTKLLENTFRHVNIALVNELAIHARALGIDIWEVIEAAGTKPFGYTQFWPGPGVGGHCLPIDPSYLSWKIEQQLGTASRFVDIANDINNQMPAYVVRRLQLGLNEQMKSVKGARVLVLGLSYKKNSNDARETPATGVITGLLELGADVHVHDSHAAPHALDAVARRVDLTADELQAADAVVLVTDHDDVDYDLVVREAAYVLDTRNRLRAPNVEPL
ncbi:MAG: nucleotide sugar dehydrogenase [Ilumatobacter sp.]|nr:MAG: nucleotide sugar dehydrogenase [Ilumatobacter sp.]